MSYCYYVITPGPQDTNLLGQNRKGISKAHISYILRLKKHERLQKIESFKNIMISKGVYFSSKIEKNKGDRDFKKGASFKKQAEL